tara:strand:- start:35019 stop:35651 length:633 start_codon:yes stop_codon:yes gene_type:complete
MAKVTTKNEDGVIKPAVSSSELESAVKRQKAAEVEMVRLVALTMKKSSKLQVPVAEGFKYVTVPPLGISPPIPLDYAERVLRPKRMNSKSVRPVVVWQMEPGRRPKGAKPIPPFSVRLDSNGSSRVLKFGTDIYAPEEGFEIFGRKIYHSVSQAQHFIANVLRTKAGIQRFITDFDTRPDVAAYGNFIISEKDREERDMLGVTARTLATV